MSGAEVSHAPAGLLMVKEEEPSDGHKTQVILHLQPILQGVNEDTAETGTTVLAIETHHEDNSVEGDEVEYGYPITCGDSRAVLLFKKFVCPGINVRCVKFNDQLISPKQFVHLAGKATLKDWKRAIRLGGVMLRKMMDSGQIDFYQHDTVCTNTCRSTKFDLLINSTRLPPGTLLQPAPSPLAVHPGDGGLTGETDEGPEERANSIAEWSPGPAPPNNYTTANGYVKRKRANIPDGVLSFWKGVADLGLMGAVLSSIRTELLTTLQEVEVRSDEASLLEADGQMLNSLCEMFGLLHSVRRALDLRLGRTEENQQQVHNAPYDLEDRLERGPGLAHEGSSFRAASSKRPRLYRTTTVSATSTTQNQTVLSPVSTSPAGQPLSVAGLPVATLAQLPTGSQLFTRLAGASAGRAGSLHAAGGGALLGTATEPGLEVPVGFPTREKEQQEPAMEDSLQMGRRTELSHFRREEEEEREGEDRAVEGEVLRTRSCDDVQIVVGEETSKKRKAK